MNIKNIFNQMGITEFGIISVSQARDLILADSSVFSKKKQINEIYDILPDAKSIIVYLLPYNHGKTPKNLSLYATGADYHKVCQKISSNICNVLSESGYDSVSFADNGPLNERKLAYRAGLGIIGLNRFLINKKYGTYTFIGYIITTADLSSSNPIKGECQKCNKCILSCPGKALTKNGFDENKCISYLTQKKGELSQEEIMLIKKGKSAWGCDICQNVCPENSICAKTQLPEFNNNLILCIKNEYLSNNEYKKKYSDRAFSWRGKAVIDRNLSIIDYKDN